MYNKIKLSTLNIRGLSGREKCLYLKEFLIINKVDICLLQETHLYKKSDLDFLEANLFEFEIKTMLCDSKSRGVAFLVRRDQNFKINSLEYDYDNRIYCININIYGTNLNLINIYAPNLCSEQNLFVEKLHDFISNKKRVLLAGDFNFVINKSDRLGDNIDKADYEKSNVKNWKKLYNNFSLTEIENVNNENKINNMMTWTNGSQSSRIDRIYIKNDVCFDVKYTDNCLFTMSDHRMVVCELDLINKNLKKKKQNSWKLNESVLEFEDVNNKIIEFCYQIPKLIKKHDIGWYDKFIGYVVNYLKIISREKAKESKKELNDLFNELNVLDKRETDSEEDKILINNIKLKINDHFKNKIKGMEKRVCDERMKFIKQPSKSLISKEINNSKSCSIEKYKTINETIVSEENEIIKDVYNFYVDLLGKEKIKKEELDNYNFKIKSLSENDSKFFVNYKVTYEEAFKVIKEMSESAPGPNGLTIGFYKKFFPYFGEYFVCILNNYDNELPDAFNESLIKLIPKNANKIKGINDLRPISLTNFEYRIFTKILSNRMRAVSFKIIGEHQTCSILGRKINDNINLLRDIIEDANVRKRILYLISVDQRKAFDSISHNYLYRLIEHMNFGEFMCSSIKRIYNNSYAKIEINKIKSEKFKIKSGIKQGCALSMFLYVLAIEELLININLNKNINGYKINVTRCLEIKSSAYADDVAGLVTDELSVKEFFNSFKEWGKLSGASINEDKTNILSINVAEQFSTLTFVQELKILGVIFNKKGISSENLKKTESKIEQVLGMWKNVNLNTIERIVACKTFALSKLWYLASFMIIPEKYIKKYESSIYKFIWNGAIEYIKRDTLILPFNQGGLNMFCIKAKLETIIFQQFKQVVLCHEKSSYQLSVYWTKFNLRELKLKNFNLIPCGDDSQRSIYYTKMIETVNKIKKLDKNYIKNIESYSSKKTYEFLVKDYYIKPNIESFPIQVEWSKIYNDIHTRIKDNNSRTINYKILMDALPLNNRIVKNKDKCYFCKRFKEDRDHLFINCQITRDMFSIASLNLDVRRNLSFKNIILQENQDEKDYLYISSFKFIIWKIRNIIRVNPSFNIEKIFRKHWKSWIINKADV